MGLCQYLDQIVTLYSTCWAMQAENALDQMDWVEKINGVITSLLSSQALERVSAKKVYIFILPLVQILL